MDTIKRENLRTFIMKTDGKLFSCLFVKKNEEPRQMLARIGVTKGVKGGIKELYKRGTVDGSKNQLTVFDINVIENNERGAFRKINLNTVKSIKFKGKTYTIV